MQTQDTFLNLSDEEKLWEFDVTNINPIFHYLK